MLQCRLLLHPPRRYQRQPQPPNPLYPHRPLRLRLPRRQRLPQNLRHQHLLRLLLQPLLRQHQPSPDAAAALSPYLAMAQTMAFFCPNSG